MEEVPWSNTFGKQEVKAKKIFKVWLYIACSMSLSVSDESIKQCLHTHYTQHTSEKHFLEHTVGNVDHRERTSWYSAHQTSVHPNYPASCPTPLVNFQRAKQRSQMTLLWTSDAPLTLFHMALMASHLTSHSPIHITHLSSRIQLRNYFLGLLPLTLRVGPSIPLCTSAALCNLCPHGNCVPSIWSSY